MKILEEISDVKHQLKEIKDLLSKKESESNILTAQETCQFLKIDRSTFDRWRKLGLLQVYSINSRLYTKKNEILDALKSDIIQINDCNKK